MALNNPFASLYKLCDNAIKIDVSKIFIKVVDNEETRNFIIDLNRFSQLYEKGESSTGEVVGFYSFATEIITEGRKKAGDHYDFYDTGDVYKSFEVNIYEKEFTISADTQKFNVDIQQKYLKRGNILGLSGESKDKLIVKKLPEIIIEVRNQLMDGI